MKASVTLFIPIVLWAQVVDTVIRFPDRTCELLYVPGGNKLFVHTASPPDVLWVVDCSTHTVKCTIPTGGGHVGVWNWRMDKVYFTTNGPSGVVVIDNSADSVVKWIDFPGTSLAYNSTDNKLYMVGSSLMAVVDCESDSIVRTVSQPHALSHFVVWDSIGNKVYAGSYIFGNGEVTAVDCETDSVVAVIYARVWPQWGVLSHGQHKLYVGSDMGAGAAIDCAADTLIRTLPVNPRSSESQMVWNSVEDKVYWPGGFYPDGDSISVVDCRVDSVLYRLPSPGELGLIECCGFIPWSNRLYFATECGDSGIVRHYLTVVDCSTDSILSRVLLGRSSEYIECNPLDSLVYISDWWDSCVYVVRDEIVGGVKEHRGPEPEPCFRQPSATIVRGVLVLGAVDSRQNTAWRAELLDAARRKVMELEPGENDIRHLAPGVYFVREHSVFGSQHSAASGVKRDASSARKVVVTR